MKISVSQGASQGASHGRSFLARAVDLARPGSAATEYASDNDIIQSVEDFLEVQEELFYQTGIQKMQKRWNKCIEVQGDYVEK